MLTETQIQQNKEQYISLIESLSVDSSFNIDGLVSFLENSDFFTAPASTMYHCAYKGGLCQHSLNVYNTLQQLVNEFAPNMYDEVSIKIVALLHDISKVDFYESYVVNKKIYSENGTKHDNMGNFDWFSEEAFKVKDASKRFICANHGVNSFMIASRYLALTEEESSAIINHHAGMDDDSACRDISNILNRYSLATLLHVADMISCYILEKC